MRPGENQEESARAEQLDELCSPNDRGKRLFKCKPPDNMIRLVRVLTSRRFQEQVSKMLTNYYKFRFDSCTMTAKQPLARSIAGRQEEAVKPSMYTTADGTVRSVLAFRPNIRKGEEKAFERI